jgi:Trk K+ transport system NAD-binding subunit
MRIIIIGAGKVGYQLAETLSKDLYDVIVIDREELDYIFLYVYKRNKFFFAL